MDNIEVARMYFVATLYTVRPVLLQTVRADPKKNQSDPRSDQGLPYLVF